MAVGQAVDRAREVGRAVVALESTIFSELGLPAPHNRRALERCRRAVRAMGAEPAVTAVLDGVAVVGVDETDDDVICGPGHKVAARDIGVAVAQRWRFGATTVSASLAMAASAGLRVFATGGIGGVHHGADQTGDISADLDALARHPLVTVCAGAKIFLDLARTLEYLETASVPVLGWRCDELPAFHARSSGLPLPHRVETAAEVAAIARAHWTIGGGGVLVTAPVPGDDGLDLDELVTASRRAEERVADAGITGAAITPAVLAELADLTGGRVLDANLSLAEHNATVAASIAIALSDTTTGA